MDDGRGLRRRLAASALLSLALIAGVRLLEQAYAASDATPPVESAIAPTDSASRVFVLLLDGWAYRDAVDPGLMPHLAALRGEGVSAKVRTVYEAFTGPAVQAAFTGRSRTRVFSVFDNFYHRSLAVESLFSDLARDGGHGVAFGEGHFQQFGSGVEERIPPGTGSDMYAYSRSLLDKGLDAFAHEDARIVIVHVQTLDWTAHEVTRQDPRYVAEHAWADDAIARVDSVIGPDATLIVMGDHGHNEQGEHKSGLNVPTFFFGRGPAFARGRDLGELAMTDVRNLVALPLGAPMVGAPDVAARAARAPLPGSTSPEANEAPPPMPSKRWVVMAMAVFTLALLAAGAALPGTPPVPAVRTAGLATALVGAAALGWAVTNGVVPRLSDVQITLTVLGLLTAALAVLRRAPSRAVWIAFAAAVVLPHLLSTAWGTDRSFWAGLFLLFVQGLMAREAPRHSWGKRGALALFTVAATLPLLPVPGRANTWLDFPPTGPEVIWLVLAFLVGKGMIFFARGGVTEFREAVWAVATMAVLALMQWWVLPTTRLWQVGIVGAFAVASLVAGRGSVRRRTFTIGLVFAAAYHAVDLPPQIWAWADGVMGALVATGAWATRGVPDALARRVRAATLATAALLGYDVALGWRVGGLEWHVLYEWFDHVAVELNVAPYVPLIVGKSILVFLGLWIALGPRRSGSEIPQAWLAVAAKVSVVLAFSAGAALVTFRTAVVMPHFEEAGLSLAFLWALALGSGFTTAAATEGTS